MNSIFYIMLALIIILLAIIIILISTIYTKLIKFNRIIKEIEKVRDSNMTKISNCFAINNARIWENRERLDEMIKILVGSLEKNKDVFDKIRSTNENVQRIYDFVHTDSIDKTNKLDNISQQIAENNKAKSSSTMD